MIPGRLVTLERPSIAGLPLGSFFWPKENPKRLAVRCPDGCGDLLLLEARRFKWDGNRERPTFRLPILREDGCRYEGWLVSGNFYGLAAYTLEEVGTRPA